APTRAILQRARSALLLHDDYATHRRAVNRAVVVERAGRAERAVEDTTGRLVPGISDRGVVERHVVAQRALPRPRDGCADRHRRAGGIERVIHHVDHVGGAAAGAAATTAAPSARIRLTGRGTAAAACREN